MSDLLPRVTCPECDRDIAVVPASGHFGKGRLWRHDSPEHRRSADGVLLSCPMALRLVDLPQPAVQLALDFPEDTQGSLFAVG